MNSSPDKIYDRGTVTQWLNGMVKPLQQRIATGAPAAIIGIRRGGVDVAQYLYTALRAQGTALDENMGQLNIAFYRDDFSSMGLHPVVGASDVPFDVTEKHIILVDDVLGTGRTVRAAMNEIFDYGRPAQITLAVLIQRTDHELPIRADVAGQILCTNPGEYIDWDADTLQVSVGAKS